MDIKEIFAQRLVKLREDRGITQQTLADDLKITRQSLSLYEKAERTINIDLLVKIANYFDISTDYLIGFSSLPKSDLDLMQASKITNIPEKTLLKLSQLFDIKNKFDNIEIGFHKYHTFFFYSSNTIEQSINEYIDDLLDGFNKAIVKLQEDHDNGKHNPSEE